MIDTLKPYREYKKSELPWLDGLAPGWRILRGKGVFSAVDVRSGTGDEELLTVSASDGVVPRRLKTVTMFMAKSYVGHKLCWPGDVVVNSLWAWMQGLGVAQHHGLISSAYSVYRPRPEFTGYARFFHYLLRSSAYKWELQTRSKGVWLSRLQLSDGAFMDMPIVLPPPDEQVAIARFLDHANGQMDRFIRAKKKVIALLNKQKQAIIRRAVTRGLDPSVPLKRSDIPWLGDIPMHWEVRRGKFLFDRIDVRSRTGDEELLTVSSSDGIVPRSTKTVMMFKAASYVGHKLCWPQDLVINSLWAWARGFGFSKYHGIVSTAYGVYRLHHEYRLRWTYFNELLRSPSYDWEFHARSRGIWKSRLQLTDASFLDMRIVIPPEPEALEIVRYIDESTAGYSSAIQRTEQEIALIREYRARLIADVVTGKLDVREAARDIPLAKPEETESPAEEADLVEEEVEEALSAETTHE
jgi:type I restriction enzyme S subunit